jgi:phenylacetate-coenzyme A ligase PaaK-like adenylate-forming protein
MTQVHGRTAHTIVGPGGELYTSPTVGSIFKAAHAYEWVRRFQVREQEGRELLILVEIHCEPSPAQRQDLLDQMHRTFGPAFTFRIEVRDELPLTPAGKYQFVVPLSRNN